MNNYGIGFTVGTKGFRIGFKNGYAVSVQFGPGNYADIPGGRFGDHDAPLKALQSEGLWHGGPTAEVAVFAPNGDFFRRIQPSDDVRGWVAPEMVAGLLSVVAGIDPENDRDAKIRRAIRAVLQEPQDD